ncbi:MAG: hypothetical protein K6T86_12860 [Pirellulales bacterium]|nr:hypothetical protein [Pirellulales bacterium]
MGGHIKTLDGKEIRQLKLKVAGEFRYAERHRLAAVSNWAAVRHYERAIAAIQVEQNESTRELRDSRRLLAAACDGSQAWLWSPNGPLTRDELDLIDLPANTLLLDLLLPAQAVAVGATWEHSPEQMALLLGLDAASVSTVASTLKSCTAQEARMELAGKVEGAIGGVATELELAGKYTFDRVSNQITWLALRIQERRSIGHVSPGLDVIANLQVSIAPLAEC